MDWDAVFELEQVEAKRQKLLAALPQKLGYADAEALCIALMNAAHWARKRQVTLATRSKTAVEPKKAAKPKKAVKRKKTVGAARSRMTAKKKALARPRKGRSKKA